MWFCLLLRPFSHCHICGAALNGFLPRTCWQGRSTGDHKGNKVYTDLLWEATYSSFGRVLRPVRRGRSGEEHWSGAHGVSN